MFMDERPLTLTHQPSSQGSNSHSLSTTHDSAVGYSSPPRTEHEISYQQLRSIRPITHQFKKVVRLIPGIQHLPYALRKAKTTPTGVVVSLVEEVVLATLKVLAEVVENGKEPPVF